MCSAISRSSGGGIFPCIAASSEVLSARSSAGERGWRSALWIRSASAFWASSDQPAATVRSASDRNAARTSGKATASPRRRVARGMETPRGPATGDGRDVGGHHPAAPPARASERASSSLPSRLACRGPRRRAARLAGQPPSHCATDFQALDRPRAVPRGENGRGGGKAVKHILGGA